MSLSESPSLHNLKNELVSHNDRSKLLWKETSLTSENRLELSSGITHSIVFWKWRTLWPSLKMTFGLWETKSALEFLTLTNVVEPIVNLIGGRGWGWVGCGWVWAEEETNSELWILLAKFNAVEHNFCPYQNLRVTIYMYCFVRI